MSQDAHELPERLPEASPGQSAASEASRVPPETPTAPAVDLSKIDLFSLPQFKELQSKTQLQHNAEVAALQGTIAQLEDELDAMTSRAMRAEQKLSAVMTAAQAAGQGVYDAVATSAAVAERDAENFDLKRQLQTHEVEKQIQAFARQLGMTREDPRLLEAERQARATNSPQPWTDLYMEVQIDRRVDERLKAAAPGAPAPAETPAPPSEQPPVPARAPHAIPPSGGSRPAAGLTDAEHAELQGLYANYSAHKARIQELEARLGR